MVSPKAGRNVSEGPLGDANGASGRPSALGRQPAREQDPDPLDDLDLEEGPLLNRERQAFELQGFQGASDSAGYGDAAGAGSSSILGGAYTPAERRRRWFAGVLSVLAALLLVAVVVIGGFGLFEWREQARHSYADMTDQGLDAPSGLLPSPTPAPFAQPTPAPMPEPTPEPTEPPTDVPTAAPTAAAAAGAAAPKGTVSPVAPAAQPRGQTEPVPDAEDTFGVDSVGDGDPSKPYSRWIYKLPHTATEADYDPSKAAPGDLAYSHMAMLTQLPNGSLASLMQASTVPGEGNAQQALFWQVSDDGGLMWTAPRAPLPPVTGPAGQRLPMWSPVLHTHEGKVHLFFSASVEECAFLAPTKYGTQRWTPGGTIWATESANNGDTWSAPKVVYSFSEEGGIPKVIANKLAVAADGSWLLPFWRENDPWDAGPACNLQRNLMGVPAVLISTDQGNTWQVTQSVSHGGALPYNWMIENTIVAASGGRQQAETGHFLQLFRTEAGIPMFASRSSDGGVTWTIARPASLPNPNSKVHAIALPSGGLLLAFDDDEQLRTPLALAMSRDGGETWKRVAAIEGHPCGQFSYPTLQYVDTDSGGRVFVAYTVLFLPAAMPPDCKARFGKMDSNTTEGLPASGMRIYSTTEALLNESFDSGGR